MNTQTLEDELMEVAEAAVSNGPGYAQESVVLREVANKLQLTKTEDQQELLACWHRLFYKGALAWGYDIDNPGSPFFHIPANGRNGKN